MWWVDLKLNSFLRARAYPQVEKAAGSAQAPRGVARVAAVLAVPGPFDGLRSRAAEGGRRRRPEGDLGAGQVWGELAWREVLDKNGCSGMGGRI